MPATRHDFTVHFHRHPAFGEALFLQQVLYGGGVAGAAVFAVQQEFHARKCGRNGGVGPCFRDLWRRLHRETIAPCGGVLPPEPSLEGT